ncbi:AAEL014732-PA [Aedes aegypti]|uniref:AAEL014732-PA n=3 Tax=Aedes aegypti TaxID=7159 RepID=A0A1S4G345_AEDAE|nr:homocysteine-responsive endoplasmic reticulum-resident ubiquitin-like domain member 2 protein isoform X1 [Aedes aegypti]EAT33011.2 AAEL014732-PA [Aedes aegypti]
MDITLIVKASNQQFDDQTIKCQPSWTIRRLKGHLTEVYPGKPSTDEQKLIYSGQLLSDSVVLKDILRHYDGQKAHTVHLVFTPKNNRHRDFSSGATTNASGSTMAPKSNNEPAGATSTAATGSRVESTRSPETGTSSGSSFGADGLRQRNVTGSQTMNTVTQTTVATNPIPPASADYIMGQHLAMQNWMQQAYMQYLNQYMNVISNGQTPQALYANAPTNAANLIIPQSSPQTNVAQPAQQPSPNPVLAQTLPNLAYYPYLSTMSSSPMPSASSIPAPITSSGPIPTGPSPATGSVPPGPSSQPTIPSPVPSPASSPAAGTSGASASASSSAPTATATTATAAAGVQQEGTAQAAPAAAPVAAGAAAAAPARRFPNIVVEEQENRDWLDIIFSMCRVGILITVVYLYSSPTRCMAVFFVGVMLYLYQRGFFRNDRADRMEFARRLVVQQINMAHMMRQRAEMRARVAPAAVPAVAAAAEAAANAQAQSPAGPGAPSTTATTAAQNDEADGSKTTDASSSSALPEQDSTAGEESTVEEMATDLSNSTPEANRMNINDVAAFLRTMVLSFITSIIPDTPAA